MILPQNSHLAEIKLLESTFFYYNLRAAVPSADPRVACTANHTFSLLLDAHLSESCIIKMFFILVFN